ncbi:AgmX/PglI C-terminal domain-containing protein, partial [bacterium]|nr:AgmX/PglI C-terminal domain-containing protein [bacterium]
RLRQILVAEESDVIIDPSAAGGEGDEIIADVTSSEGTGGGSGGGSGPDAGDIVGAAGLTAGGGAADLLITAITSNVIGGRGGVMGLSGGEGTSSLFSRGGTVGIHGGAAGAGGAGGGGFAGGGLGGAGGPTIARGDVGGAGGGPTIIKARPVNPRATVTAKGSDVSSEAINEISSYIRQRGGQIKVIYEKYLKLNPNLQGRIVVKVTFTNGVVSSVTVTGNDTGNTQLESEIVGVVRGWAVGGVQGKVTLSVPFVLSPK